MFHLLCVGKQRKKSFLLVNIDIQIRCFIELFLRSGTFSLLPRYPSILRHPGLYRWSRGWVCFSEMSACLLSLSGWRCVRFSPSEVGGAACGTCEAPCQVQQGFQHLVSTCLMWTGRFCSKFRQNTSTAPDQKIKLFHIFLLESVKLGSRTGSSSTRSGFTNVESQGSSHFTPKPRRFRFTEQSSLTTPLLNSSRLASSS